MAGLKEYKVLKAWGAPKEPGYKGDLSRCARIQSKQGIEFMPAQLIPAGTVVLIDDVKYAECVKRALDHKIIRKRAGIEAEADGLEISAKTTPDELAQLSKRELVALLVSADLALEGSEAPERRNKADLVDAAYDGLVVPLMTEAEKAEKAQAEAAERRKPVGT